MPEGGARIAYQRQPRPSVFCVWCSDHATTASSRIWQHIGDGSYWQSLADWAKSLQGSWIHSRNVLHSPLEAGECVCTRTDCVWYMYKRFHCGRKKREEGSKARMGVGQPSPLGRFPTLASQVRACTDVWTTQ